MSDIISKTLDGFLFDQGQRIISFKNCSDFHYNSSMKKVFFLEQNIKQSLYMSYDDFQVIKELYDNYNINNIALDLIKNDPISSVNEIYDRAKQFYILKNKNLNKEN